MVTFTESATLIVKDQSTPQIKRINAALKQLQSTANSLKSMKINLTGLTKASADARRLTADLNKLKTSAINLRVNTSGLSQAARQIAALRTSAAYPVNVNTGARRSLLTGGGGIRGPISIVGIVAISNIHALASALLRSTKEGYKQTDVADTKMALKQFPEEQQTLISKAIKEQQEEATKSPTGALLNRAQRQDLITEASGSTGGDVAGAAFLVKQAESLIKVGMGMGQSFETARTGAIDFIKAGEQMGQMSDTAGKFDPAKAAKYFDTMRRATMQIGQEFTGQQWRTTVQSAGQAKTALNQRGLLTLALAMEEQGSRAGVGLNEAIKNLSTQRLDKKKIANLERMGLVTTEQIGTGKIGGKTVTEIFGKGATDEGELRRNMLDWVINKVIPKMEQQKVDINDPAQVAKWSGKVTSGKGTDFLSGLILRSQEILRDIKQAESRKADISTTDLLLKDTGVIVGQGIKNQIQSVLGEMANKAEPIVLSVLKPASETMSKIAEGVREGDPLKIAAAAGGGILAGGATAIALKAAAPVIGRAMGIAALTDPKTASLGAAGLSLIEAAGELKSAAAALHGIGPPSTTGGDPTKSKVPAPTKDVSKLPWWQFLTLSGGLSMLPLLASTRGAGGKSNLPDLEAIRTANESLAQAASRLAQLESERADPSVIEQALREVTAANAEVARIARGETRAPSWIDDTFKQLREQQKGPDWLFRTLKSSGEWPDGKPFTEAPLSEWLAASSTFNTTFQTGASAITTAATTAGSTLESMAPSIGSAIGAAFAARASQVRVGVDASTIRRPDSPLDTGANSARD